MLSQERLAERQVQMRCAQRAGRGRPRRPLDRIRIFELALLGHSNRQIALQLGCDHKTLARFAADLQLARLRRQTLLQCQHMRLVEEEKSWTALRRQLKRLAAKKKMETH